VEVCGRRGLAVEVCGAGTFLLPAPSARNLRASIEHSTIMRCMPHRFSQAGSSYFLALTFCGTATHAHTHRHTPTHSPRTRRTWPPNPPPQASRGASCPRLSLRPKLRKPSRLPAEPPCWYVLVDRLTREHTRHFTCCGVHRLSPVATWRRRRPGPRRMRCPRHSARMRSCWRARMSKLCTFRCPRVFARSGSSRCVPCHNTPHPAADLCHRKM